MSKRVQALRLMPAWVALLLSVAIHLHLMFFGLGIFGGSPHAGGEQGLIGAGGDSVEITVVGADAPPPSIPAQPLTPLPTEPDSEPENRRQSHSRRTLTSAERDHRAAGDDEDQGIQGSEAPNAPQLAEALPEQPLPLPTGSDRERTGRAAGDDAASVILGSVGLGGGQSASRSLLERALTCDDPIEGVWVAHRYSPARRDWGRMTLRIEREGDELRGTITSRVWSGLPSDRRPLPCALGRFDVTVRMPARGRIDGDRFSFGASSYEVTRVDCPSPGFMYYPDSFRGRVDPLRDEMNVLNNDGHVEFDAPYRFRRTSCGDD